LIGEQASRDQRLAGLVALGAGPGQALAQGRVGVVTEALGIRPGDPKEREGADLMAELIDRALTDEARIHPAELAGNGAEVGQRDGVFVQPECLRGQGLRPTKYRSPMVAGGGRGWRCPLVTSSR
jgi:hypothetical protein